MSPSVHVVVGMVKIRRQDIYVIVGINLINRGYFPESVNASLNEHLDENQSYICKFFCLSRSTVSLNYYDHCKRLRNRKRPSRLHHKY